MAKIKLVSLNLGVRLTIREDGQDKMFSFSIVCPTSAKSVQEALESVCDYINMELGTNIHATKHLQYPEPKIEIVKPKEQIKAQPSLTHKEFNQKIKELQP